MSKVTFLENLRKNPRPVVLDFWAPWCMPCRAAAPVVRKLGEDYAGRVDLWKVNADEQPDLLRELRIFGVPTMIAYHNGEEVTRRVGVASKAALAALFEAALAGVLIDSAFTMSMAFNGASRAVPSSASLTFIG